MREADHNVEDPRPTRRRKLRLVSTEALPATQLEIDKYHLRLRGIRTRQLAGRKTTEIFEYLVDENLTWITEDQLRISLSLKMLSELKGNYMSYYTLVWKRLEEYVTDKTRLK